MEPKTAALRTRFRRHSDRYAYRPEEWAQVIGMVMVTPPGYEPRPCLQLRYNDGKVDFIPITEMKNLEYEAIA